MATFPVILPLKDKTPFGQGNTEGIIAPEAANNGAVGALVPMLALGVPGSATSAIILALMIHGIQPGAEIFTSHPDLVYFYVGNAADDSRSSDDRYLGTQAFLQSAFDQNHAGHPRRVNFCGDRCLQRQK